MDLSSTSHRPATIFVVEDEADAAHFTALALERAGHRAVVFSNPSEALTAMATDDCDLLLSDVRLPDMSGLELLERVGRQRPDLPVVLMTAFATVDDTIVALRHGAADYLLKPLTVRSLADAVDGVLAAKRSAQERILAIGAHPDDVEIGVGGTLAGHARRGDHVTILTLSGGESGGAPSIRRNEAQRAAELLGAELVLGSLPDTRIADHGPTVELIEQVLKSVAPTTVYTHSRNDVHQDHRAAHRATLIASRGVSRVLCYQSPSATVEFAPNRFVTVDGELEQKLLAIGAYRSQTEKCDYLADDLLRATTRYWGRFGAGLHAEPLEVVRERIEQDTSLERPHRTRCTTPRKELHHAIHAA